jgi:glucosamine-6-phosphate deaminase
VGLPPVHVQSYAYYMQSHLFQHIDAAPEHIHIPSGIALDLTQECARYDELLTHIGQLDLQLLGLGHNGHIGFNEPDHALIYGTHVVELSELTRAANARFFKDPQLVPKQAITMGVGMILKAKTILLVVKGADKADILHQALKGDITTACPASLLQMHPHLVVLVDRGKLT